MPDPRSPANTLPRISALGIFIPEIPRVSAEISHGAKTPPWMIDIGGMLVSTVANYASMAELYGWYAESARITTGNTGNLLMTSAAVQHSNVYVIIPNGSYAPSLETSMNTGATIAKISIVRFANIASVYQIVQQIDFTNCMIGLFKQDIDELLISFIPRARTNTINQYDQTGTSIGSNVTNFDYTTGVSS